MGKFVCLKCDKELSLSSYKIRVHNNKVVSDQAVCCDEHMEKVRGDFNGWGSIKRGADGKVKRKSRPWE